MNLNPFPIIKPDLQVSFYRLLSHLQQSYLSEALRNTVLKISIRDIDSELSQYVESVSLTKLASFGIRGEIFFPVPCVLTAQPSLLGYYRLLYGLSQKQFYRFPQLSMFKRMEEHNQITDLLKQNLTQLCIRLSQTGSILLDAMGNVDLRTLRDLQLITLGAQLRGSQNTKLGKDATVDVFSLIVSIVHDNILEETPRRITLTNAAGRNVIIAFSSDPDITFTETMPSGERPLVSIEIKGGTDISNIHNRIGEAEKSHQKAKSKGFFEFWTIIGADVDISMAKRESPTSSRFFHLGQIKELSSQEYKVFSDLVQSVVGIKTH